MRDGKILGLPAGLFAAVIIIAAAVVASIALFSRPDSTPVASQTASPPPPAAAMAPAAAPAASAEPVDLTKLKWSEAPTPAPTTPFTDAAGVTHTLADFAGKVLVVNFWATWCAPCVKEMPTLDALQGDMGGEHFAVVTINQDREGMKVAEPFVAKNGWKNLALYLEPAGHFARDAKLGGLPTSLVIDRQGREVARLEGTMPWNAPEVEAALRKAMDTP